MYFPQFYEQLADTYGIPSGVWKIVFEYQHELYPKMDGYYTTPFDFVLKTGFIARLEFLGLKEVGFWCSEVALINPLPSVITMSIPQSISKIMWQLPHPNYDPLAMYQFCTAVNSADERGKLHDEFIIGQLSWCRDYLRISSFQETRKNIGVNGLVLKFVHQTEQEKEPLQFSITNQPYQSLATRTRTQIRKRIETDLLGPLVKRRKK